MAKKIIRTVAAKNGNLIKFLPEGTDTWLSLDQAIEQARAKKIDAVVARNKNGQLYLRAKSDKNVPNNFDKIAIKSKKGIGAEWKFATGIAPPHSRQDPNKGWNSKARTLDDTIERLTYWVANEAESISIMYLPWMKIIFSHWLSNSGEELMLNIYKYISESSAEYETVQEALSAAADFAEVNLKVGQSRTIMTESAPRRAGNMQTENTDLWYAIGGHTGYAKALIKKISITDFEIDFFYRLEDFFTFGGKTFFPEYHEWHLKGLAHDFLIGAEYKKTVKWKMGEFDPTL